MSSRGVSESIEAPATDERAVYVDRSFGQKACLPAEVDRLTEELFKHFTAQSGPRLGEDAVVRRRFVEVVAQEPAVSQMQTDLLRKPPFGGDAIEVAHQQHLEDDQRVD
jgi:hypothetical protein